MSLPRLRADSLPPVPIISEISIQMEPISQVSGISIVGVSNLDNSLASADARLFPDNTRNRYNSTVESDSSFPLPRCQALLNATIKVRFGTRNAFGLGGSSANPFSVYAITPPPVPSQDPVLTAIPPIAISPTMPAAVLPLSTTELFSSSTIRSPVSIITSLPSIPSLTRSSVAASALASTSAASSYTTIDLPSTEALPTAGFFSADQGWNFSGYNYAQFQAESRGTNTNYSVVQLALVSEGSVRFGPYFSGSVSSSSGLMASNTLDGPELSSFTEFRGTAFGGGSYCYFSNQAGVISGNAGGEGRIQYHYPLNTICGRVLSAVHAASGIVGGIVGGAVGSVLLQPNIGVAIGATTGRVVSTVVAQCIPSIAAKRVVHIVEAPVVFPANVSYETPTASGVTPSLRFEASAGVSAGAIYTATSERRSPIYNSEGNQERDVELGDLDNSDFIDENGRTCSHLRFSRSSSAHSDTPLNENASNPRLKAKYLAESEI